MLRALAVAGVLVVALTGCGTAADQRSTPADTVATASPAAAEPAETEPQVSSAPIQEEHPEQAAPGGGPCGEAGANLVQNNGRIVKLRDLKVGQMAYVVPFAVWNYGGKFWLRPDYPVERVADDVTNMCVERRASGFHVWASADTPPGTPSADADPSEWLPVSKLYMDGVPVGTGN